MKKFTTYFNSKRSILDRSRSHDSIPTPDDESPEGNMVRAVKLFCETKPSEQSEQGEEVLQLPVIVEAAESSPEAACLAARQIRKYISTNNSARPHTQYNAIMLIRILADNPGQTFTRNIDDKFVSTVKHNLRGSREPRVQQMMRETLTTLYRDKQHDPYLQNLLAMWRRESGMLHTAAPTNGIPDGQNRGQPGPHNMALPPPGQGQGGNQRHVKRLPPPEELAARIEEAKTSAKLLQQLVQSTPQNEMKGNDLIVEFAERCQSAQRSMQGYINADNPAADDQTMQTLIETSEQLSLALSKHSRALLSARRAAGAAAGTSPTPPTASDMSGTNPNVQPQQNLPPQGPYVLPQLGGLHQNPVGDFSSGYGPPPLAQAGGIPRRNVSGPDSTIPAPLQAAAAGQTYSPPPLPPPTSNRGGPPPALQPQDHTDRPSTADDDPFSDRNAEPLQYDTAEPLPPQGAGLAHSGMLSTASAAAAARPGYSQLTPSYVRRQDSSEAHLTMHGATGLDDSPVSPDRSSAGASAAAGHNSYGSAAVSPVLQMHAR